MRESLRNLIEWCSPVPAASVRPQPPMVSAPVGSTWAMMFDPGDRSGFNDAAAMPNAVPLPAISMVLVPSSTAAPPVLPNTDGLVGGWPSDGIESLLAGLDWMAALDQISAAAAVATVPPDLARFVVGGTMPETPYPFVNANGTMEVHLEPDAAPGGRATPPARLPVVNLSLAPVTPYRYDPNDAVNFATWVMSGSQLCIFAVGNDGDGSGSDMTSPWARAPWVVGVGATEDPAGFVLAPYSSRGVRHDIGSGPDLVAWGQATLEQSAPKPVGTSFAAPEVTRYALIAANIVLQLAHAVRSIKDLAPVSGIPLAGWGLVDNQFLTYRQSGAVSLYPGAERLDIPAIPIDEAVTSDHLAETLRLLDHEGITYDVAPTPDRLRRILVSMARPMPEYGPHEAGAGFLYRDGMYGWWERFSGATFAWLFGSRSPSLETVDRLMRLGLVPRTTVANAWTLNASAAPAWAWNWENNQLLARPASTSPAEWPPWTVIA